MIRSRSTKRDASPTKAHRIVDAEGLFSGGVNCAQAIVAAYGPELGLEREYALKVAGAFGSGMGIGETCGAVTGALMIIGLRVAKIDGSRFTSRDKTYHLASEFVRQFKYRHGTVSCRDLLGCDLSTPEGRQRAKNEKYFEKRCPKFVHDAAEILEEMERDAG